MRYQAVCFLNWPLFDNAIGCVIAVNSFLIGWQSTVEINGGDDWWFIWFERFFLVVYGLELLVRFMAYEVQALISHWTQFDLFLFVISCFGYFVQPYLDGKIDLGGIGVLKVFWARISN